VSPTAATAPKGAQMVNLDADGCQLPSDWYLQATQQMKLQLSGQNAISQTLPLSIPPKEIRLGMSLSNRWSGDVVQGPGVALVYDYWGLRVIGTNSDTLWEPPSNFDHTKIVSTKFEGSGNLVLRGLYSSVLWSSSNPSGFQASVMKLCDREPYLQIVDSLDNVLWASSSSFSAGFSLNQGNFVQFNDPSGGRYFLSLSNTGSLVLKSGVYQNSSSYATIWKGPSIEGACAPSCKATFESDGNFYIYNGSVPILSSQSKPAFFSSFIPSRVNFFSSRAPTISDVDGNIMPLTLTRYT